ncbi:MAG: bifunctional glutamate N-acetyltransferase/amino-acid acetyltransferase ArgJ [Tindallia sp. MSAO_Bac2]|nr:MAG: bifunctional glutamate N-acetyltransferase/amino-acid acetyltransferase ArgJ [Tindallia sp. MSAO_Bac2]
MNKAHYSGKEIANGTVTSPKGFIASGVHTGVKEDNQLDLAILFSKTEAIAAGVFTQNQAMAAPVIISKDVIKNHRLRGVVINSGNANACTGSRGMEDAKAIQAKAAELLNISPDELALASTGVIGLPLPLDNILSGIPEAVSKLSENGGKDAAKGIMTTDTINKEIAVEVEIDNKIVTVAGMAKGSGMIHPNMATMLGFITTDAAVKPEYLQNALQEVTDSTFNMITVDGDTSTNDTVIVLANGKAENHRIDKDHPERDKFFEALQQVSEYLAKSIVRDGEGASKFIEAEARGFKTLSDARKAARTVLSSNLVKTAIFGGDGNWGRMICSLGYSGAPFNMETVELTLGNGQGEMMKVLENGLPLDYDESFVEKILEDNHISIIIEANVGAVSAKGWGCDLTYEYVKINGSYRS